MTHDVDNFLSNCKPCNSMKNRPPAVRLKSWPKPETSFQRLYSDYGQWKGFLFLLCIDSYSNLIAIWHVNSTDTEEARSCFKSFFKIYEYPVTLVTDNGSRISGQICERYCASKGINYCTCRLVTLQAMVLPIKEYK